MPPMRTKQLVLFQSPYLLSVKEPLPLCESGTFEYRRHRLRWENAGEGYAVEGTHALENSNIIWFSSHLFVPLSAKLIKTLK